MTDDEGKGMWYVVCMWVQQQQQDGDGNKDDDDDGVGVGSDLIVRNTRHSL